jgi:hypothetical protein
MILLIRNPKCFYTRTCLQEFKKKVKVECLISDEPLDKVIIDGQPEIYRI